MHHTAMTAAALACAGLIGWSSAWAGDKSPPPWTPGWKTSDGRFVPTESIRDILRPVLHEDPNEAGRHVMVTAFIQHPSRVLLPGLLVLFDDTGVVDKGGPAGKLRKGITIRQLAAFALDMHYSRPPGAMRPGEDVELLRKLEHVDLKKLDERADFWKEWFRRKTDEAFGREQVRKELGMEGGTPGPAAAPSQEAQGTPASRASSWVYPLAGLAGGVVIGAAAAWLLLRRRPRG